MQVEMRDEGQGELVLVRGTKDWAAQALVPEGMGAQRSGVALTGMVIGKCRRDVSWSRASDDVRRRRGRTPGVAVEVPWARLGETTFLSLLLLLLLLLLVLVEGGESRGSRTEGVKGGRA